MLSQNSVIFGAMLLGFIVYVTIKGKLASYVSLFWKSQGVAPTTSSGSGNTSFSPLPNNNGIFGPGQGIFGGSQGVLDYLNSLPASDQGFFAGTRAWLTGYYPSGLPSAPTLGALTNQAASNVAAGGPL